MTPGDERNGAEGAKSVATFRYLQIGIMSWRGEHALAFELLVIGLAQVGEHLFPVEFPIEFIHIGKFGLVLQFGKESLGKAAHHKELFNLAFALSIHKLQNHVD